MVFYKQKEQQSTFITSHSVYQKLIPDDDIFAKIDKEFSFDFIYDEVKDKYCANNGRPCKDPVQMFKACLVQRLKGLTDPEMELAAKYDIRIKHFLRIKIDDVGFDYSTIWYFRERLGSEIFENIFNKILNQIKSKGIIKDSEQQFIDSMPVLARATLPSVTSLLYMAMNDAIKSVCKRRQKLIFQQTGLDLEKLEYYSKPRPLFRHTEDEKRSFFQKAVSRGRMIIDFFRNEKIHNYEITLLEQILSENVNENDQQKFTPKNIKTLKDKDAKLGHKTKEDLIFGYKNHTLATQEGIITAVSITSAADRDDEVFEELIKKSKKNKLKPKIIDADSAYGFIQTFATAEKYKIILNAPFRGLDPDKISVYDLKFDSENKILTCLNGIEIQGKGKNNLNFEFPIRLCKSCPKKDKCPIGNSKRTQLHKDYQVAKRAIDRQRTLQEKKKLAKENNIKTKSRLIIENLFAYLEKLGGKFTNYFNKIRTENKIYLVSITSNIMKTIRSTNKC
jgi:IS5 family transposase